ncbi:MAG: hypothetical protein KC736_01565 [Candidatus Moranbacteria bacterium]|nr:hypothetical protein [Candidatus Moranbacteria bacterium]
MKTIKEKSYARITLSPDIIRKITNSPHSGYHEMGIIKHMIDLYDIIHLTQSDQDSLTCSDPRIPTDDKNTCIKAIDIFRKKYNTSKPIHIHIEKNIPTEGGLAGGSSNAATVLKLLYNYYNTPLSPNEIKSLGRQVGMDVPYFFLWRNRV